MRVEIRQVEGERKMCYCSERIIYGYKNICRVIELEGKSDGFTQIILTFAARP